MENNVKEPNKKDLTPDEVVEEMVKNWDIVRCKICGEKVSMLDARLSDNQQYFICKKHF